MLILAACASDGGRFDPIRGTNACDFTPVGPSYPGALRHLHGLQRARVLGFTRERGSEGPISLVRIARPDAAAGNDVQRLTLTWTPDRSGAIVCHVANDHRVCIARMLPSELALTAYFDLDVIDAENRTRGLLEYVRNDVVCAPEGLTGEDLQ